MPKNALQPLADSAAAPGQRDLWREELAAIIGGISDLPDDFRNPLVVLGNELERGTRLLWRVQDHFWRQWADSQVVAAEGALVAGASVPVSVVDKQVAIDSARAAFITRTQQQLRMLVGQRFENEAAEQAKRLAEAALSAERVIGTAEFRFALPSSLTDVTTDLAELLKFSRAQVDLKVKGVFFINDAYTRAEEIGDIETMKKLEDSAAVLLDEVLRTPIPKPQRGQWQAGAIDQERLTARRLLSRFESNRRARIPPEIVVARKALERLKLLYRQICGNDISFLSRAEFSHRYLSSDTRPPPSWTEVDPQYHIRRLPPSDFPLPGWSAKIAKDEVGNPIREAAIRQKGA